MKTGRSIKQSQKLEKAFCRCFFLVGAVFFGAVAVFFVFGHQEWEVWGLEITIDHWLKPWWLGTFFWLLSILSARSTPGPVRLAQIIWSRVGLRTGLGEAAGKGWLFLGAILGIASGAVFSIHYYYILRLFVLQALATVLAGALGGALHFGFYRLTEIVFSKSGGDEGWRPTALRLSLYLLAWSALITQPFFELESLGTEPLFEQLAFSVILGIAGSWLVLARWRMPGVVGKARQWGLAAALVIFTVVALISWQSEKKRAAAPSPRDRVLLITVDTTRADYLSCYGYPRDTSPNMDRLAGEGARFARAFCTKGVTDPSHASILTGFYPRTHGLQSNHQRTTGKVSSMAEVFKRRGYKTIAVTSREHVMPEQLGVEGFDEMSGPNVYMQKTSAREAFRRAANQLYHYRDRNVFMWVHFFDPHDSYEPHPGYADHLVDKYDGKRDGDKFLKPGEYYSKEEIKYMRDLYAGEIYYMDHWIGKLVELAGELAPRPSRPPFVLIVGDHGEAMGEYMDTPYHFGFGHGAVLYNGGVHVPLIIHWPGRVPAGTVIKDAVDGTDVSPTIVDYIFDIKDYRCQGQSLRPVMADKGSTDKTAVVQNTTRKTPYAPHVPLPEYAFIKGDHKLLANEKGDPQLFDLAGDWKETEDLADTDATKVKALEEDLRKWEKKTPFAEPEKRELSPREKQALRDLGYIQ